ncbi:MAG: hypothetical protein GWP48_07725 [Actinobacteria bacterium]|nr:hypothetical protein [Actinomycetota bacterium]
MDTESAPSVAVDFDIFSSDEGAGCAVYVSVSEADVGPDIRALIWQGIVSTGFTDCGFSEVVEVGLLTVNGLDSYNQPDWSQTIQHGYFAVSDWDSLIANCYVPVVDDGCTAQIAASFTE